MDALVPLYLESLENRGLAVSTRAAWGWGLRLFIEALRARRRTRAEQIQPKHVAAFQVQLSLRRVRAGRRRGLTLAPGTIQIWMSGVRGFCRWLVDRDLLLLDPCADLAPVRAPAGLPRVLTETEVNRLFQAACEDTPYDTRDLAFLELAYSSGLRVSELVQLNLVDLDLVGHEALIRRTKRGTSRRVPVGAPAVQALLTYLTTARDTLLRHARHPDDEAVFVVKTGRRLSVPVALMMMQRRVQAAGLTGPVTLHSLRHTAAVHLLAGGADIRHVQQFLGHANVETTVHYTRLVLADLKATLARCHPRGRWTRGLLASR